MGCLGECWDVGPPPDSILSLPPPPIPAFLQHPLPDLLLNTTPCSSQQLCESLPPSNRIPESGDYVEMSRKGKEVFEPSVGVSDLRNCKSLFWEVSETLNSKGHQATPSKPNFQIFIRVCNQ